MLKRKDSMVVKVEGDKLEVTPLGAGNEVGRSCVYMTYKGKTVLVLPQRSCRMFRKFQFVNAAIRNLASRLPICIHLAVG